MNNANQVTRRVVESLRGMGERSLLLCGKNVEELLRPEWLLLLSRTGNDVMFYILRYCSVFVPGEGLRGLLQLSGSSVVEVG